MVNKKLIKSTIVSLSASLALLIVVFLAYGSIAFGWFSSNKVVDLAGMNISVNADDTIATYYVYKYDTVVGLGSTSTTIPDAQGSGTTTTPNLISRFTMHAYDTIFVSRNVYNYIVVRVEVSGFKVPEAGTLDINLNRILHDDAVLDEKLNPYMSSCLYFKGAASSTLNSYLNDDNNVWVNAKTVFDSNEIERKRLVSVTSTETVLVNEIETEVRTYAKADSLTIPITYTQSDWVDDKLNVYIFMDYDEVFVDYYIKEHRKTTSLTEGVETELTNDFGTIAAKHY